MKVRHDFHLSSSLHDKSDVFSTKEEHRFLYLEVIPDQIGLPYRVLDTFGVRSVEMAQSPAGSASESLLW